MFTGLTVAAHGVVETVITHTSTDVPRSQIHRHVKMTLVWVTVTVAFWEKSQVKTYLPFVFVLNVFMRVCSIYPCMYVRYPSQRASRVHHGRNLYSARSLIPQCCAYTRNVHESVQSKRWDVLNSVFIHNQTIISCYLKSKLLISWPIPTMPESLEVTPGTGAHSDAWP